MKIYYASQSFYPHIGGVSTYLLNLCRQMVNKGNEVVEVHLRPSGEIDQDEIKGIEVYRVPKEPIDPELMAGYSRFKEAVYKESHYNKKGFTKPADEMDGFSEYNKVNEFFGEKIRELLEQDPADAVHIHDFQLLFTYRYVPRGIPCILTWHIPFIDNMSKHLSDFLIKHLKEYDKIVFSSQEYIDAAVRAGLPEEKAELIHPMANTELFMPMKIDRKAVRKKYGMPADAKVILCVQRVDTKSGHEQLIKAMPEILKKVPDAVLVFVGSKSLSSKLSKEREAMFKKVKDIVKELGLEKKVIFTGNIDYNLLPQVYNSVDLVALCSKNEGFGLSVTEGMACGNPIVGTKVGGIPIQVRDGENGFLVDAGDVEATADSIIRILGDNNLRKRMERRSLEIVYDKFRMEVGVEKHLMLYNDVRKHKDEFHKIEYIGMQDIRGIITDLDRTLTDEPAKAYFDVNDFDRKILEELKSVGIDLFLATGRNIHFVKKLCNSLDYWRCVIAENGAVIYFPKTKKTVTINTLHMTRAKKIIRNIGLEGCVIGKVIASIRAKDEAYVRKELGELAEHVTFSRNVDEIMVLPKNVDKGLGIRLAMRYLNIDVEKTIVVGDAENDVDMFLNPGFKFALANSHQKLKKLADQTSKKPSIQGIMELIEKIRM
ncbi:glycosyltransferase [Candidatus Woesearchaeota archaeon]|nr:glycosyltransferase [Candidatus Woesearchaeota archaeon]